MDFDLRPVSPATPAAPYIGGKRNLARRIISRIEATPHDGYAEPFVGMGGVFLRRALSPRFEAINDISGDVATFFRILQRHYVAFLDMLRFQLSSRREFERLSATDPSTLTDLERAARFLYLQRLSFGGRVAGRNFGVDAGRGARFNVTKLGPILEAIHERLADVVIEQLSWQEFLRRYDRPGMLFYLDPPYFGAEHFYGRDAFSPDQFAEMADRLREIRGRFILSINDHPEVRRIFEGFGMEAESVTYTTGDHGPKRAGELVINGPSKGLPR